MNLLAINLCAIVVATVCVTHFAQLFIEQKKTGLPRRNIFLLTVWIVVLLIQCRFLFYLVRLHLG